MAYEDNQSDNAVPVNGIPERKSSDLLPKYFRTQFNKKFLASTLDQIFQPGTAEKVSGYLGRRTAKAHKVDDNYIPDISADRENYQLEPATIVEDNLGNVNFFKTYQDYINSINNFNGTVQNHSILNQQEYYSWDPQIDWDKFVNFREYYWLPYGPQTVNILGQSANVETTINVISRNNDDNKSYVFFPDGLTNNPNIKLYRGQTYTFNIDAEGMPFAIRTAPVNDEDFNYDAGVSDQKVEQGTVVFQVTDTTPDNLYYVNDNDINASGMFIILDIDENSSIDVEKEILDKKTYTSGNGITLSNGMKVRFAGTVTPATYASSEYYVEGVGDKIKLIAETDLEIPSTYSDDIPVPFDAESFDRLPFGNASAYAGTKDYITINRASIDGNAWTKYNRWVHKSVIEASASANGVETVLDQNSRAIRPIIEFRAGLKLYNFGTQQKQAVDIIDTFTTDVFSTIEGSEGYNIDGVQLTEGMRVLFVADTDILVKNRIYEAKFITHVASQSNNNNRHLTLVPTVDSDPVENETVLIKQGDFNKGKSYWYNGETWLLGQNKDDVNQAPLFDLYDKDGYNIKDDTQYTFSTFTGNKIFSYTQGTGTADSELGFALSYRNINNVGDIEFTFDLPNQTITYQDSNRQTATVDSKKLYARIYSDQTTYISVNGWVTAHEKSSQNVVRQYEVTEDQLTTFAVDVYDNSASVQDLQLTVFVNNVLKFNNNDYTLTNINNTTNVVFNNNLSVDDIVIIKAKSTAIKNQNGYYEIPINLERNPLNADITSFTLGEVNDHLITLVDDVPGFVGQPYGNNNIRDLGQVSKYGNKFVKHSCPLNLPLYHLTSKNENIIKAIRNNLREYSKFKRAFLETANSLGFDGNVKDHVDNVLKEMNKDKNSSLPFYFTDMLGYSGAVLNTFTVRDSGDTFFALDQAFDMSELSPRSVNVYLNDIQLIHNQDYNFTDEGFVSITADKVAGDIVKIYEYESTDGCFIPATPTKLGLYPKFVPEIFTDNTYLTDTRVIQGHDGSITFAFNDFRDNLLLELETRIFNNIKIDYDDSLINFYNLIPGENRTTGVTRSSVDSALIADFIEWNTLANGIDYTQNYSYTFANSFTYNYKNMVDPEGNQLPGSWRAVYKHFLDTDRPHTHPWEILGFKIKPNWWESQYGSAPYTSNNLLMWEDISQGIVRANDPLIEVKNKFIRPNLLSHLPVDENGELISPLQSGYAQQNVASLTEDLFEFGDEGPVETAWRRSSQYPFSLLIAYILNKPCDIFGTAFDLNLVKRSLNNQIVLKETEQPITLDSLKYPNTTDSNQRIQTSGLINYVYEYIHSDVLKSYNEYKTNLASIDNKISSKLAGFTTKEKFNLILDSRTPLNQGNVFIPEENYNIVLNSSTPVEIVTYSGVIVEKQTGGFIVRGYDRENPIFKILSPIKKSSDPVINVGGISESFVEWEADQTYIVGSIVRYNNIFYKCKERHVSTNDFNIEFFAKLNSLPVTGGRNAFIRKDFVTVETTVPYGTSYSTIQEVVDFLLGYQEYLKSVGFIFDYFNRELETVETWDLSVREFMFWTTQNWNAGSLLTLSPGANRIKFQRDFVVVDDIFDDFYNYNIYDASGVRLQRRFLRISREKNTFSLETKNTADGIYAIKLPLIQIEHVLLIDNRTVFNDIIYDKEPGYRQERIKVIGYKAGVWNGSLTIPGFIYDDVTIADWHPYQDYVVGDIVKYKEYYYVALEKIVGNVSFTTSQWKRLDSKPTSTLKPNFDYKTNQFADFYDLDSDNFDSEQQKLAQHAIGYQQRDYLANIINDDVSQYKFYQGYIRDKGTKNSLDKLFTVLGSADKDSLEFNEEWAVRLGVYGAIDAFEEVEYILDESKFKLSPQPVELVRAVPNDEIDLIYRLPLSDVYSKPQDYNHAPLPTEYKSKEYSNTAGYVYDADVNANVYNYDEIVNLDIDDIDLDQYVWVGNISNSWNVYHHTTTEFKIESIVQDSTGAVLNCDSNLDLNVDEIIGIHNTDSDGFYKVVDVKNNTVTINAVLEDAEGLNGYISKFDSVRRSNFEEVAQLAPSKVFENSKLWVDSDANGKWKVIQNNKRYSSITPVENPETYTGSREGFADKIVASSTNNIMVTSTPETNKVIVYNRSYDGADWVKVQTIEPDPRLQTSISNFGKGLALSSDGRYLVVGAPNASGIKSKYQGNYSEIQEYSKNDIVKYNENIWRAIRTILPGVDNTEIKTFSSYAQNSEVDDSTVVTSLVVGDHVFPGETTRHLLVRAPATQFEGSSIGDTIRLKWNLYSNINPGSAQPFSGGNTNIDDNFITGFHQIIYKIEQILVIGTTTTVPVEGSIVVSSNATGTVSYSREVDGKTLIYVTDVNGTFDASGILFTNAGDLIGEFLEVYPDAFDQYSGFFAIATSTYTVQAGYIDDVGRGLVYVDYSTDSTFTNYYENVFDTVQSIGAKTSGNDQASFLTQLTYQGDPYNVFGTQSDSRWAVRVSKAGSDLVSVGESFSFYVPYTTPLTSSGFTRDYLNGLHEIADIWDGYIDFEYTEFDVVTQLPFEPTIGDIVQDNATGATAEVVFYKRNFNDVRIYVKNVTGNWSDGELYGDRQEIILIGTPNRLMGDIVSVSLGNNEVGKLLVIDRGTDFDLETNPELLDVEYWTYSESIVAGIPRSPNLPAANNNDWEQVYNIPLTSLGTASSFTNEGAFYVYEKTGSFYNIVNGYTVPETVTDLNLGNNVELSVQDNLYRLAVGGSNSIYFIKNGTAETETYNWNLDRDQVYRGQFSSDTFYFENDIVEFDNKLYQAVTNIASGESFDILDWNLVETPVAYLGFIPSNESYSINNDSYFNPANGIADFGTVFKASDNGQVLAVLSRVTNDDNVVLIYRSINGHYTLDQQIPSPEDGNGFGTALDLSPDGRTLIVGEPLNSIAEDSSFMYEKGIVHVYKLENQQFVLKQIISSPNEEENEQFGYSISAGNDTVAITSLRGDIFAQRVFDNDNTVFDNDFTKFLERQNNVGSVHVYEHVDGVYIPAQLLTIDLSAEDIIGFGKSVTVSENHVYVGMPDEVDAAATFYGKILDFRKDRNTLCWSTLRTPYDQVDVKKIKGIFLYNTQTNTLIERLDFIDPIQGKIAGPAEQNISYKTPHDPAVYTHGTSIADKLNSWGEKQVGKLWWDLSKVKWYNAYQDTSVYQTNYWNKVYPGSQVEVWEWVESPYTPLQYAELADTEDGLKLGISGILKYDGSVYVQKRLFDNVSQTFSVRYYFWVKNKVTLPNVENRTLTANEVSNLITNPAGQGYRYVSLLKDNRFVLHNIESSLEDKNVAVNFQYWTIDQTDLNIHTEYQLLTEGVADSKPKRDIEEKWFDSLIGYDKFARIVPDSALSEKQKYGISTRPRQSMFVNRIEALKQVIEKVNAVCANTLLVDDFNLIGLNKSEAAPAETTRLYDQTIDSFEQLQFIGVAKLATAVLSPVVVDGEIVGVDIISGGRGYKVKPTYTITGVGEGAVFDFTIDSVGAITNVEILSKGAKYDQNTTVTVRNFAILVESDTNSNDRWSIYQRNSANTEWERARTQSYKVDNFWNYIDWYDSGYSQFTAIDHLINFSYELPIIDDAIGDTVKIKNVGTGGWLLLEKIADTGATDYTVDYKTVGKQNGTVQFDSKLYDYNSTSAGYDSATYDISFFDNVPNIELRIILETIRDHIFVDELEIEYNKLFFSSLRYILDEQNFVDWIFKTSFVRAKHNVGELEQKVTFQNDNLSNYQDYIHEVKPYKSKVREYVSSYEKSETATNIVTDFDLPPTYRNGAITPYNFKIVDGELIGEGLNDLTAPHLSWKDNFSSSVDNIKIASGGSGYTGIPVVTISGGGGTGATAKAYVGRGRVTNIEVTNSGTGYTSTPTITIEGGLSEDGVPATASIMLASNNVRSVGIKLKFDRIQGQYVISDTTVNDSFTGTGAQSVFALKWPIDVKPARITITVNGTEVLPSQYTVSNKEDTSKSYIRQLGEIRFNTPPASTADIRITYNIDESKLAAEDRIFNYYNPTTGQLGKDLNQLIDGLDYGGVEITSFDFGASSGWDSDPWFTSTWDTYDTFFEDEVFTADGSTISIELNNPLEDGIEYNVYKNGVRLDDPNYGTANPVTNQNAIMQTITGDGVQTVVELAELGISTVDNDVIVVRKITSDGSITPDPTSYDTALSGGNLAYTTATGLNAEDIIVDGDQFITVANTTGPEEMLPGRVTDTLDLRVYDRPGNGSSNIFSSTFVVDPYTNVFTIDQLPDNENSIFVKINNTVIATSDINVDFENKTVTLPTSGNGIVSGKNIVNIVTMDLASENVLDIDEFVGDGSTLEFVTNVKYQTGISQYVTIEGVVTAVSVEEADEQYGELQGNAVLKFSNPPIENKVVRFGLFKSDQIAFSQVAEQIITGDGSSSTFALENTPLYKAPTEFNMLVSVDDTLLRPGYKQKFTVTSSLVYALRKNLYPAASLTTAQIKVYLNSVLLEDNIEYRWNVLNSAVELFSGVANIGDNLEIYVNDGEYTVTGSILSLDTAPALDSTVKIITFSNHDLQEIERNILENIQRTSIVVGDSEYEEVYSLTTGRIRLQDVARSTASVFIFLNGNRLVPSVDFFITEDGRFVQLVNDPVSNAVIDIVQFTGAGSTDKFGYRIFKDMLNRYHYKRLNDTYKYTLTQDLNWYDLRIELDTAEGLPTPNRASGIPGIIFINGERIEYFVKEGNTLRQLRRGTLGTGVKEVYSAGTKVYNQSSSETIPYKDTETKQTFDYDGSRETYDIDFDVTQDNIEVFVGGTRYRKNAIPVYDYTQDQDSPEGDVTSPAEFTVNTVTNSVTLSLPDNLPQDTKIQFIKKTGFTFAEPGASLRASNTDMANFIRSVTVDLPE